MIESQYIDPDGEVRLKSSRSSVHDTRDRTGYIQPSDPSIVADYWVTRRRADTFPGYDLELPDIREIYRWNGSAWIVGYRGNDATLSYEAVLSCLHSNNGWRIEGPA